MWPFRQSIKWAIYANHLRQPFQNTFSYLTLWLWLVDKSTHRTCLLAMDGRQTRLHDSTIVPRMVDILAELIINARNEWLIKQPKVLSTLKRWKVMFIYTRLSTYAWKLSFLVLHFKNFAFTLTLYFRYGRSYKSQPVKLEYQKKVRAKQELWKRKLHARSRYVKNYLRANWRLAKKLCSQRVNRN